MGSICSLEGGAKDREAKGLLPPLVPCRRALGPWSRPLIFLHLCPHPCACSSQSPLVGDSYSYSNPTQMSLPWTSLPHSSNKLSYSWDFFCHSYLLKDQAVYMVDCVLLEDRSRLYSPMHLPWFPKKGFNGLLLSLK